MKSDFPPGGEAAPCLTNHESPIHILFNSIFTFWQILHQTQQTYIWVGWESEDGGVLSTHFMVNKNGLQDAGKSESQSTKQYVHCTMNIMDFLFLKGEIIAISFLQFEWTD